MFPNLASLSRERGDAAHGNHGGSKAFVECVCLEVLKHSWARSRVIEQGLVRCHEPLFVLDVDEILGIELRSQSPWGWDSQTTLMGTFSSTI